jgi:N-acetylglucosaminyldiphosphoundecaprenol N-acetyl-beta-D-mannosaminyltransferase
LARLFDVRGLVVTPNPEILLAARSDSQYQEVLNSASLALPDGVATQFAVAALHDVHDARRHPGVDVVPIIATIAEQKSETVLILGGYAQDHERLRHAFSVSYPGLHVVCIDPGAISETSPQLSGEHMDAIRRVGPAVAIVALGQGRGKVQGKQERIAQAVLASAPNVRFAIGVGGAVDVFSGNIPRAPKIFQRLGFEWAWRFLANPWRLPRIFRAVVIFPMLVAWDTMIQGRFRRACRSVCSTLVDNFFPKSL